MCGLAGVIYGEKRRRAEEREHLACLFSLLLVMSERRGPHATGIAWLNREGEHGLFKRPEPARHFVRDKAFHEILAEVDNRTTLVLGHTRWRTLGDERINENNHPIRAGDILGTHNGTIYNAEELFRRFKLPRFAEVDSELLFRLAGRAAPHGPVDTVRFKNSLKRCRGQMTAVLASRLDPETILVLKGNKPLALRFHRRHRAILYASEAACLDAALVTERGWQELAVPPRSLIRFRHRNLFDFTIERFQCIAEAMRPGMTPMEELR